jgi:hypothetical protein
VSEHGPRLSWRDGATALTVTQLASIEETLDQLDDLGDLFHFRADADACQTIRTFSAYLRSRAIDIRDERDAIDLDAAVERRRF